MAAKTKTRRRAPSPAADRGDVYSRVTDTLVAALEAGTAPWRKPWRAGPAAGLPMRMSNGRPYRGVNNFMLWIAAASHGYASDWWGTYDQIAALSGMERRTDARTGKTRWVSPDGTLRGVRAGEKSTEVLFWKRTLYTVTDPDTGEQTEKGSLIARTYRVFNAEQANQLPARYYPDPDARVAPDVTPGPSAASAVIDGYLARNPGLTYTESNPARAFYQPSADLLNVPPAGAFDDVAAWHGVRFHECAHSTGHPSRLNRKEEGSCVFGSPDYAREELVAEMTSAMLAAITGTATPGITGNNAAYLASWIRVLKGDSHLAIVAAAAAQKAADMIQGITYDDD